MRTVIDRFFLVFAISAVGALAGTSAAFAECLVYSEETVCATTAGDPPCTVTRTLANDPPAVFGAGRETVQAAIATLQNDFNCECSDTYNTDGTIARLDCHCMGDGGRNWVYTCDPVAGLQRGTPAETAPVEASVDLLYGEWNVDFVRSIAAADLTVEERAMAEAMMRSMTMQIRFDAAGVMSMTANAFGEDREEVGTFRVISADGPTLTIETTTPDSTGQSVEIEGGTITFESRNVAVVTPDGEQPLYMNRR